MSIDDKVIEVDENEFLSASRKRLNFLQQVIMAHYEMVERECDVLLELQKFNDLTDLRIQYFYDSSTDTYFYSVAPI